jgi:hypothetical protein
MNQYIRNIVDHLLFHSSYLNNVGFFHGKMGIVVAMYAYANRYKDKFIEEYAWDLLQEVYDGIHADMPIGIESGLAGIGYAITLLCEKGWIECDLNAVLSDIDSKIMERDPRRITDFSIRTGAKGLQAYLTLRKKNGIPLATFDEMYIIELHSVLANQGEFNTTINILELLNKPIFPIHEYIEKPIEIDGGSAYYILNETLA